MLKKTKENNKTHFAEMIKRLINLAKEYDILSCDMEISQPSLKVENILGRLEVMGTFTPRVSVEISFMCKQAERNPILFRKFSLVPEEDCLEDLWPDDYWEDY